MAGSAGVMVIDDTTCIVQLALRTAKGAAGLEVAYYAGAEPTGPT